MQIITLRTITVQNLHGDTSDELYCESCCPESRISLSSSGLFKDLLQVAPIQPKKQTTQPMNITDLQAAILFVCISL
jgi:hypothetical protein